MSENQTGTGGTQDTPDTSIDTKTEELSSTIKNFHSYTLAGIGLILVFIVFCFISTLYVRWWLMAPIAISSAYLLFKRKDEAVGLEKQVCTYGAWAIVALFIFRDISLSYQMAAVLDLAENVRQGMQDFLR